MTEWANRPFIWSCRSGDCGWCYSNDVDIKVEGECIGEEACRRRHPEAWKRINSKEEAQWHT